MFGVNLKAFVLGAMLIASQFAVLGCGGAAEPLDVPASEDPAITDDAAGNPSADP